MKKFSLSLLLLLCSALLSAQSLRYRVTAVENGKVRLKNGTAVQVNERLASANPADYIFESRNTQMALISPKGQLLLMPPQERNKSRELWTLVMDLLGMNKEKTRAGVRGPDYNCVQQLQNNIAPDPHTADHRLIVAANKIEVLIDTVCFSLDAQHYFVYRYQLGGHLINQKIPFYGKILHIEKALLYPASDPAKVTQPKLVYIDLADQGEQVITEILFDFRPELKAKYRSLSQ